MSLDQEDIEAKNDDSLKTLVRAIIKSQGQFSLILARSNYSSLRHRLMQKLADNSEVHFRELVLKSSIENLYAEIETECLSEPPSALIITRLEQVSNLEKVLNLTNQARENFRDNFQFPLVLWVSEQVLQILIRVAQDFYNWASIPIEFELETNELIDLIKQTTDNVFDRVLEAGAGRFLDNATLGLENGSPQRFELKSAYTELQNRGIQLPLELQASIEFVRGRAKQGTSTESQQHEEARQHYEQSLTYWKQQENIGTIPESQSIERLGCVLFSLGLWWGTYAERHLAEYQEAFSKAKDYFQESINIFKNANRLDLVAKFVNALALALQKLKQWNELETIAQEALDLQEKNNNLFRLARDYGFLAEVALNKSNWKNAQKLAEKSLSIFLTKRSEFADLGGISDEIKADIDWESSYHQPWYLFTLAQAQAALGQVENAIDNLEKAKTVGKAQYDPRLYIGILDKLRELYYQKGQYRQAFEIKLKKHSIEQQFGFRAFVGPGPLKPEREINNPAIPKVEPEEKIAREIEKSGRKKDIKCLLKRIERSDSKLTVIYGKSGVGKSSLLQAGLMPILKQKMIGIHKAVPVLMDVYSDCIDDLGICLTDALVKLVNPEFALSNLHSQKAILKQLRENSDKKLLTVLIFDEFEVFLFSCQEYEQRKVFLFLKECLDIPYVKLIISIREDYLHLLKKWERTVNLKVVNNNILDKNILYYLSNYSKENAKDVIESLIQPTQFLPEPELIEQLVQDLADDSGEIRPIELQLVGSQLETEKVTTLQKYQALDRKGVPKNAVVKRFLETVIKDCGSENEEIAKLVLYLLTDKNNTHPSTPSKSCAELKSYLEEESEQLELVLEILTKSWLVVKEPGSPYAFYRLAYDYLVPFIREDKDFNLREELKQTKEELRQALVKEKRAKQQAEKTKTCVEIAEIETLSLLAFNKLLSGDQLGATVAGVKACRHWLEMGKNADIDYSYIEKLRQAIYGVKELNRLESHNAGIWDVSFSPDGTILASASVDETIKLWQLNGSEIKTLIGHTDWVWSIAFSPDGQLIASASDDNTVKLWQLDGTEIQTLTGHSASVKSVHFSPDGQLIASASDDNTVKLWQLDGTEIQTFKGHSNGVNSVCFAPDGRLIASASDDNTVKLWQLDGIEIRTLMGHQDWVLSVDFSPDGQMLASASADETVRLWRLDGSKILDFQGHNASVRSVRFSPDGQFIASASADGIIKIWRTDGTEVQTLKGHRAGVRGINFHPYHKILASVSGDKTVRLWHIEGAAWKTLNDHYGHRDWIWGVSFSPDGKILASGSADKTVRLWKFNEHQFETFRKHTDLVRGVSFSPDGKMLASGSADKTVIIWRLDGEKPKILKGHQAKVWSVAFSPDSQLFASASDDKTVLLWQLNQTNIEKPIVLQHQHRVRSVRFSPDGKIIASGDDDGTIYLWNINGQLIFHFQAHKFRIRSLSFHKDGNKLASVGAERIIRLWQIDGVDRENCKIAEIQTFKGHTAGVWSVDFSPNGEMLASASSDGTVRLWRLDGTEIQIFQGHDAQVFSVSFSPDGKLLASSSADRSIKLWRLDNLQPQASDLEGLLEYGCNWVRDYLRTNPKVSESDRHLCDDLGST